MTRLYLNEFKEAYRALQRPLPRPLHFLLLALLVWLEQKYIDAKAVAELEQALETYRAVEPPVISAVGVYSESGSDFFDEMRITTKIDGREVYQMNHTHSDHDQ